MITPTAINKSRSQLKIMDPHPLAYHLPTVNHIFDIGVQFIPAYRKIPSGALTPTNPNPFCFL